MECLIGIQGQDFVVLAADTSANRSIVSMMNDHKKMYQLGKSVAMLVAGESGDTVQFAEYISKNIQLYKIINGYELSPFAAVQFVRHQLANYLRSQSAYQVNMLIGGYDPTDGPSLFFMDYLASCIPLQFAMQGYGSHFGLSIMDRYYTKDITKEGAIQLLEKVIKEIGKRLVINLSSFKVHIIDKDGLKSLPDIKVSQIRN